MTPDRPKKERLSHPATRQLSASSGSGVGGNADIQCQVGAGCGDGRGAGDAADGSSKVGNGDAAANDRARCAGWFHGVRSLQRCSASRKDWWGSCSLQFGGERRAHTRRTAEASLAALLTWRHVALLAVHGATHARDSLPPSHAKHNLHATRAVRLMKKMH